jgi:thioesterase domain-containing protein
LRLLATRSPAETARKLIDKLAKRGTRVATGPNPARQWLGEPDANLPLSLRQVQDAGGVALTSYVPKAYDGKIVFLKAETTQVVFPIDPANVWSGIAKSFEMHAAPGDHASMIHEHADGTAECISQRLARVRNHADAG